MPGGLASNEGTHLDEMAFFQGQRAQLGNARRTFGRVHDDWVSLWMGFQKMPLWMSPKTVSRWPTHLSREHIDEHDPEEFALDERG